MQTEHPSYNLLTLKQIQTMAKTVIQDTAIIIGLPKSSTRQLLLHFKWNSPLLIEQFFEAIDVHKWLEPFGVNLQPTDNYTPKAQQECGICFETTGEIYCLTGCHHTYCRECLAHFVAVEVGDLRKSDVFCPQPGCKTAIDDDLIIGIDQKSLELLWRLRCDQFVECSATVRWCPGPKCNSIAVALKDATEVDQVIECQCGHRFCFNCVEPSHEPLPCFFNRKWNEILVNLVDVSSAAWMSGHTRLCPGCSMPIEKTGGCDHMACVACKLQFNWSAALVTNAHAYRSTRFQMARENYSRLKQLSQVNMNENRYSLKAKRCCDILANTYVLRFFVRSYETEFLDQTVETLEHAIDQLLGVITYNGINHNNMIHEVIVEKERLLLNYVSGSIGDWNYNE